MVEKLDLVKENKSYYSATKKPQISNFDGVNYLSIEGKGSPDGEEFHEKVQALYPIAYGIKKLCKDDGRDFGVPKLEGLWWVDGPKSALDTPREQWKWKLLIRMPEFVSSSLLEKAQSVVSKKKSNPHFSSIALENIKEGKCAQVLHIGPYKEETKKINELITYISDEGLKINGLHHEIYLSDPNKTDQGKMKTIIRYPVQ